MKKIIILLLVLGFTKAYAQEPVVPVAKKVVNKFIKFGTKAGLNFNAPSDIDELSSEFSNVDNAKESVSGFYIGVYSEIKILMLYLRPELHFTKYDTNYDNITVGQSRIEVPVSLGIKVLPILSGFAGPTFRYKLEGDKRDYSIGKAADATLGIHFGVRIHLGKLGLDVRYDRGISKEEVNILSENDIKIGLIDNRPRVLSLGLSYAF